MFRPGMHLQLCTIVLLINMAQNPQISCYKMEVIQEKIGTKMTKFMVISYLAMVLVGWE